MPELPEVETIAIDLQDCLVDRIIQQVKVFDKKIVPQGMNVFSKLIVGKKIKHIGRRAKMLFFNFYDDSYLVVHFKMTGQLVYSSGRRRFSGGHPIVNIGLELPNKFTRVIIFFKNDIRLFFNDVRRFGWMKILSADQFAALSARSGIEPLGSEFTFGNFLQILSHKKNSPVKQAIMDQKFLVGVGNIYADESLFAAKIKPFRQADQLSAEEARKLYCSIKRILTLAIKHRGTSFSDYVDAMGKRGNFLSLLKVYGRAGKTCKICGQIISKIKFRGRGTHWCADCQQ